MAYQPKDMTGTIFANDRKEKPTHPDRRGDCIIDGVSYWISGWVKKDKNGNPFLSLAFKAKDAGKGAGNPTPQQAKRRTTAAEDMNDEIPW